MPAGAGVEAADADDAIRVLFPVVVMRAITGPHRPGSVLMGQHEVADRMEPVRDPVRDVPGRPARALHARPCIRLLGRPRLLDADGRASGLQYRKGWALLAWLSLESRGACRRTRLAALLWPRLPESAALTNLRQVLADLNRSLLHALGTEVLHCDRTQVHWRLPAAVALNVAQLHRSIDPALPRDCGTTLCMLDAGALEGELLEGIELDECEEFGQWLAVVRESLARNRVRAIEAVRDCLVREGRMAEAIGWARSLVAMDGWDESRCRGLMRVLAWPANTARHWMPTTGWSAHCATSWAWSRSRKAGPCTWAFSPAGAPASLPWPTRCSPGRIGVIPAISRPGGAGSGRSRIDVEPHGIVLARMGDDLRFDAPGQVQRRVGMSVDFFRAHLGGDGDQPLHHDRGQALPVGRYTRWGRPRCLRTRHLPAKPDLAAGGVAGHGGTGFGNSPALHV